MDSLPPPLPGQDESTGRSRTGTVVEHAHEEKEGVAAITGINASPVKTKSKVNISPEGRRGLSVFAHHFETRGGETKDGMPPPPGPPPPGPPPPLPSGIGKVRLQGKGWGWGEVKRMAESCERPRTDERLLPQFPQAKKTAPPRPRLPSGPPPLLPLPKGGEEEEEEEKKEKRMKKKEEMALPPPFPVPANSAKAAAGIPLPPPPAGVRKVVKEEEEEEARGQEQHEAKAKVVEDAEKQASERVPGATTTDPQIVDALQELAKRLQAIESLVKGKAANVEEKAEKMEERGGSGVAFDANTARSKVAASESSSAQVAAEAGAATAGAAAAGTAAAAAGTAAAATTAAATATAAAAAARGAYASFVTAETTPSPQPKVDEAAVQWLREQHEIAMNRYAAKVGGVEIEMGEGEEQEEAEQKLATRREDLPLDHGLLEGVEHILARRRERLGLTGPESKAAAPASPSSRALTAARSRALWEATRDGGGERGGEFVAKGGEKITRNSGRGRLLFSLFLSLSLFLFLFLSLDLSRLNLAHLQSRPPFPPPPLYHIARRRRLSRGQANVLHQGDVGAADASASGSGRSRQPRAWPTLPSP